MSDNPNGNPDAKKPDDNDRKPEFMSSLTGRTVSIFGLVERIVKEFHLEHGEDQSETIKSTTSDVERRQLVRDVAEYIFGIESAHLSPHEQARVIALANGEIFGYGPLDSLFADETVSTISLEGARKAGVRYGPAQEIQILEQLFDDTPHMQRIIQRLLRDAGAELREDVPIIETGLTVEGRRVSLSVAVPPFVPEMAVDIRVHPAQAPTFDDWIESGIINQKTVDLLQAIIQSKHGLIIVGDTESGKTTLASMLVQELDGEDLVSVERASELFLPEGATQLATHWPVDDDAGVTFGEQIQNALATNATTIIIDEIRNDETHSIAPLLTGEDVPRQIWSFRGTAEAKRLTSALGMLARMSDGTQSEHMVYQLNQRLPFVVSIKRRKGKLQVREVAEWQFPDDANEQDGFVYADFVSLMRVEWDDCQLTGKLPQHELALPDHFWDV